MPALERVLAMLDEKGVAYEVVEHKEELTALGEARASSLPPSAWAKCLAVRLDGRPALAVLPATLRLDFKRLGEASGAEKAELIPEDELAALYPDCDIGAVPPFGNLYGQSTYVDVSLCGREPLGFHAGTHTETIVMDYLSFEQVAAPVVGWLARDEGE
jgi:Ala-tRNA(Pro) deacylase